MENPAKFHSVGIIIDDLHAVQENRDIPTIEILDEAIPPSRKSSPKVIFSTVVGSIFIFLIFSLFVVVKEKKVILLQKEVKGG